ncbi:flavodoxin domain-containing protein [Desulfococcaceae bacterium HSG7]|nr:flavodoxin domain-containing protein [Desulfococcaceae bacterium HSG9]MDM8556270.1 flavodoxin domain-containing protein [Desulfococcaceae bacterium HSG7]
MAKALIVYATRTGSTKKIAELIAEGFRSEKGDARIVNVNEIKKETDLEGFDAYMFGSATYHGDMMQSMKTLLFLAEKACLEGKVGGSFGAFGWSGEAPGRIYDTMKNICKMNMVSGPLRLKSASLGGGEQTARDYGSEVGKKSSAS